MTGRPTAPFRSQSGITLIELLVTMIILSIVTTMLVGAWISLQRAYAFTSAKNNATAQGRDAIDRVSSEIRTAQGITYSASPSPTTSSPFIVDGTGTSPYGTGTSAYLCDATHLTFYSAYNNSSAASQSGDLGRNQLRPTAIWLDQTKNTLLWRRDTNNNGLDDNDRTIKLASNVVNTAASVNKNVFTYNVRNALGNIVTANSLTSANVNALVSIQIEIIADVNLTHTPTYVDLMTTVEPRNLPK
jgi:prepilin-type N-terminal cleavage/methylation domain-containing protein